MAYHNASKSVLRLAKGCTSSLRQQSGCVRAVSTQTKTGSGSLFDPKEDSWDHVFEGIDNSPQKVLASSSSRRKDNSPRQQTMTAREIHIFEDMFSMLFNAHIEEKQAEASQRTLGPTAGIGRGPLDRGLNDVATRLRQQSKNVKWTSEADEELDRKKEEMMLCDTDQQLLEWAMREVFGESQRYEEAARKGITASSSSSAPQHLQPLFYPHVIALLMATFRDRYANPHLALSIFDHARHLSIASFVFGCTTPAYNELIETRWRCFRDVRGVCDALEEMRVNGVEMDNRTRALAETVRREIGERNVWEEESSLGSGEVWGIVRRIEQLTANDALPRKRATRKGRGWNADKESWKRDALKDDPHDDWEFGKWEQPHA